MPDTSDKPFDFDSIPMGHSKVLERGQGLADITADTHVVAVVMPNIDGIRSDDWDKYATSVDRIEASTGYDFLDQIPDTIEQALERN